MNILYVYIMYRHRNPLQPEIQSAVHLIVDC